MKKEIYFYLMFLYSLAVALLLSDLIFNTSLLWFKFHLLGAVGSLSAFILFFFIFDTSSLGQTTYLSFAGYFVAKDFALSFSNAFFWVGILTWLILLWESNTQKIAIRPEIRQRLDKMQIAWRLRKIERQKYISERLLAEVNEPESRKIITANLEDLEEEEKALKNLQQELAKKPVA